MQGERPRQCRPLSGRQPDRGRRNCHQGPFGAQDARSALALRLFHAVMARGRAHSAQPLISAGELHEIKYDSYRMHARPDGGKVQLLTCTGLDWSKRYRTPLKPSAL
jgi:ATP-dependent DNA ligase